MDKKQKVWIRGCEGKGAEVIQKLVAFGGEKPAAITIELAFDPGLIFFISHFGGISYIVRFSELARIIMEEYTEIKLDEKVEDEPVNNTKEQPEFNVDEKAENEPVNKTKEHPEFKVDDMVLRREKRSGVWKVFQYWYILSMGGLDSAEIIPYNEETKHLLNTTGNYER